MLELPEGGRRCLVLCCLLLAAGCSSGNEGNVPADGGPILSGDWVLPGATGSGGEPIAMTIEGDSAVAGYGGCNRFFGRVAAAGSSVTFGPLGSTRRACQEPVMRLEDSLLAALGATAMVRLSDSALAMLDQSGGELLVWARAPGTVDR